MEPYNDPLTVSRAFWALPARERKYAKVAELLGMPVATTKTQAENHVGYLVRQWEEQGNVQHLVAAQRGDAEYLNLMPNLEDPVRRRYGLRDVVVVDIRSIPFPPGDPQSNSKGWDTYDDRIHEHLGRWAARVLTSVLRDGDGIGTGGGRGPFYTAKHSILPRSALHFPDRAYSLTGHMSAQVWSEAHDERQGVPPRGLDADAIAQSLTMALGIRKAPKLLGRAITERRMQIPTSKVDVALIGIGALAGGHRLVRYEGVDELLVAKEGLLGLNSCVARLDPQPKGSPPFFHWVCDMCNYLFVVSNTDSGHILSKDDRQGVEKIIAKINDRFVTTRPRQLTEICDQGLVLAVAGGPHKAAAIEHVLKHRIQLDRRQKNSGSKPCISHLVTDNYVADYLTR